ncbi:MAG TPA: hypothetical protein VLY23_18355 [Candidatus Acidoferrum sp.]|nr:hypothetical protein [Candidatus Acidoferrum sp.]
MPFIRGRYHINPVVGQALEAARQLEEAMQEPAGQGEPSESGVDDRDSSVLTGAKDDRDPIHRVEIETAETAPSHSGRGEHGFVARIHRTAVSGRAPESGSAPAFSVHGAASGKPETRVFSDHDDLIDFRRNEFAKGCRQ